MKKSIIVFALAVASSATMSFGSIPGNSLSRLSPRDKAASALHEVFPDAQNVQWHISGNEIIARFNSADGAVRIIYNEKGKPLSTLIDSDGTHMPFNIRATIRRNYPDFQMLHLTEYTTPTSHHYYILLKKQKGNRINWIRLQSDEGGNLTIIQRIHQVI